MQMRIRLVVLLLTLSIGATIAATTILCTSSEAQNTSQTTYRLQDYPVLSIYRGKVRLPDFKRRDKQFSLFRTRIIEGIRDGANFAGKYSVVQIGCGTGCRFGLHPVPQTPS
jgi:hypothetical protein